MEKLLKYFPEMTQEQTAKFALMERLYPEWNAKINVISRKDIDNLEINHILHSLSIAKMIRFTPGTRVLDFGTGGGFPAIPLAVMFPEVKFHLVDRIGKKLKVAQDIATQCHLDNVTIQHGDIGEVKGEYDFIVSRAVMDLDDMVKLVRRLVSKKQQNSMPNGVICLKGGDLSNEIKNHRKNVIVDEIKNYFTEPYLDTKKIVYLPL